jgi:hypothetical protein
MIPIFLTWHLIGIVAWCQVDVKEQSIQCNYESKIECESYAYNNEICIPNPNLK